MEYYAGTLLALIGGWLCLLFYVNPPTTLGTSLFCGAGMASLAIGLYFLCRWYTGGSL